MAEHAKKLATIIFENKFQDNEVQLVNYLKDDYTGWLTATVKSFYLVIISKSCPNL